jgi:hypothetical protein
MKLRKKEQGKDKLHGFTLVRPLSALWVEKLEHDGSIQQFGEEGINDKFYYYYYPHKIRNNFILWKQAQCLSRSYW